MNAVDIHASTPKERAERFILEAQQFRLGKLLTESAHPTTANLSQTAKEDVATALGLVFQVDQDVIRKYEGWAASDSPLNVANAVITALQNGGRIFCTGCGATGRLSIQMNSIWREFWQELSEKGGRGPELAGKWEDRTFSVMAGGDYALIKSVEGFEDFTQFGRRQIADLGVREGDVVFAITEGGETSFVIGTAWEALDKGAKVFFVYNNPDEILRSTVERSREVIDEPMIEKINLTTGPMAITGSTRMQATSIQLCVMMTIFEMALRAALKSEGEYKGEVETVPAEYADLLKRTLAALTGQDFRDSLAKLVRQEQEIYTTRQRNNYFAKSLGIDVLTDTTERSPTFTIPAFKKWNDQQAADSWSFLFLPYESTDEAWTKLLKRKPQAVEWPFETVAELIGRDLAERQHGIIGQISYSEIHRFRIGLDGMESRPVRPGDQVTAIVGEKDFDLITNPDGFFRKVLNQSSEDGASTAVIAVGSSEKAAEMLLSLETLDHGALSVFLETPSDATLLQPSIRVGIKMMLNCLSTVTLVRMGRVLGNVMIWVSPTNLKLIDRATRYISQLGTVDYNTACQMLFEVMDYVAPRMQAGQEYPAPVGVAAMRLRHNLGNEAAEERLYSELNGKE